MKNFIKQTALIRPPSLAGPEYSAVATGEDDANDVDQISSLLRPRLPNMAYVYRLTCFVSLGGFLFGWDQGVMAMIIADERWLRLMQPANDCFFADVCGRERTISLASVVFVIGALQQAASNTIAQISIGRFVLGLGVGAYSAGVPLYTSEIAPPQFRGRIVGILMMILCFAEMVVFFVDYAFFFLDSDDWWRLPLVIQIVPALFLAIGCWSWVPPSPRWLVSQERYECALEVLTRLHGSAAADEEIRAIREAVEGRAEVIMDASASWSDMFRRPVLRVTLLGTGIQMFQQTTGTNGIFYYAPKLFKKGGITDPKLANLATGGIGLTLFLSAWIPVFYFDRFGRKTWFQVGLMGMAIALVGICILQQHAADFPHSRVNYVIVLFPYLFFTFFNMSWSAGSWTYAAEIFPLRLRISPPIESATGYGLYILFIINCIIAFLFVRYALVETKGRSLEEMEELFGIDSNGAKGEEESRDMATQALLQAPLDDQNDSR
ncbi:hypothetical protein ONZ43_g1136 [Nemania bipapillata]|uniref:Uncharacterized protein n=1 Tax=Nemania bipapillata TaxID=110536 RepID=A0ACC2J5N2_9PEZI|nr:hypothetical protein ONZ43_g1136 [Nemania bipapillata]